jgi:hypothetical protein
MLPRRTSYRWACPGLFHQYNAPADFVETANTIGLPRYAKQAVDQQFARWVRLHVQCNPAADLHASAGADQGCKRT